MGKGKKDAVEVSVSVPSRVIGRPSLFNAERCAAIVDGIARGLFIEYACADAGVGVSTVRDWLNRGMREGSGPYFDFYIAVNKARRDAESKHVVSVEQGVLASGQPDWKASAWLLSKMNPLRYGDAVRIEVTQIVDHIVDELRIEFENEPEIFARVIEASSRALSKED